MTEEKARQYVRKYNEEIVNAILELDYRYSLHLEGDFSGAVLDPDNRVLESFNADTLINTLESYRTRLT